MGAFLVGSFIRVRWREAGPDTVAVEACNPSDVFDRALETSPDAVVECWGIAPDLEARLIGRHIFERDDKHLVSAVPDIHPALLAGPPSDGRYLVGVQLAGHCWAVPPSVDRFFSVKKFSVDWGILNLPGTNGLTLGRHRHGKHIFRLVYPPPPEDPRQIRIGCDNTTLVTTPFATEDCRTTSVQAPMYRYGVLVNGVMQWLDKPPAQRIHHERPATTLFRAKLAELKIGLAKQGIFYKDDPDEKHHHRESFDDAWESVPPDWDERQPPIAYSVSGKDDNQDKEEKAISLFVPDSDEALLSDQDRIGFRTFASRMDIISTEIIYLGGVVARKEVSQLSTGKTIALTALLVGLRVDWNGSADAAIRVAMPASSPKNNHGRSPIEVA